MQVIEHITADERNVFWTQWIHTGYSMMIALDTGYTYTGKRI